MLRPDGARRQRQTVLRLEFIAKTNGHEGKKARNYWVARARATPPTPHLQSGARAVD